MRSCFCFCLLATSGCLDRYLDPPEVRAPTVAVFDPASGALPFPHDALLLSSDDGTVDVPIPDDAPAADPRRALNALNGFSITEPARIPFSRVLDPSSVVVGESVRVFYGFSGREADDGEVAAVVDAAGTGLLVVPLAPLPEATTIVVIVTNDVEDEDGEAVAADRVFKIARSSNPLVDANGAAIKQGLIDDDDARALEPLRALTSLACAPALARGVSLEELVMCLPFTTQRASDVMQARNDAVDVDAASGARLRVLPVAIAGTEVLGLPGAANLHVGALQVTRRLSFLPSDDESAFAEVIPLLISIPKAPAAEPRDVVIFQHGITRDRTDLIAVADAFAAAGIIVIAADLPLHGLTGNADHTFAAFNDNIKAGGAAFQSAFFDGLRPTERTRDFDLINNATKAPGPDGIIDPSGTHLMNLGDLLHVRNTMGQGIGDLRALGIAAAGADVDGDGVDDVANVSLASHSLGSILGASACAFDKDSDVVFAACALSNPGAQLAHIFAGSPTFGPELAAGLAAAGVEEEADVASFLLVAQTVLDGVDPWLALPALRSSSKPMLLVDVENDLVVPERVPLHPLAGGEPWLFATGFAEATEDLRSTRGQQARVHFVRGDHTSLLSPAADAEATAAWQKLVVTFLASGGTVVDVDPEMLFTSGVE